MTQILIQAKGFDLTGALQEVCQEVGQKLIKRSSQIEKIEFFLEAAGHRDEESFIAKVKIAREGKDLFVEAKAADMYQAIKELGTKTKIALEKPKKVNEKAN